MNDINIIENNMNIITAFGNFDILNDVDVMDHPSIYRFAKIVSNYIHMKKALK